MPRNSVRPTHPLPPSRFPFSRCRALDYYLSPLKKDAYFVFLSFAVLPLPSVSDVVLTCSLHVVSLKWTQPLCSTEEPRAAVSDARSWDLPLSRHALLLMLRIMRMAESRACRCEALSRLKKDVRELSYVQMRRMLQHRFTSNMKDRNPFGQKQAFVTTNGSGLLSMI